MSSLRLARLFLTQQLIYKSKIEKRNISLDIFASKICSIARNFHLPGQITFNLQPILLFFGSDFSNCVVCPPEVDKKWVPAIFVNLIVKSKLPPQSDSHSSLEAVEHHPWEKGHRVFLFFFFYHKKEHLRIMIIDLSLGK